MMDPELQSHVEGLMPGYIATVPQATARSLVSSIRDLQTRIQRDVRVKAGEEPALLFACAHMICEELRRKQGDMTPVNDKAAPMRPGEYKKLHNRVKIASLAYLSSSARDSKYSSLRPGMDQLVHEVTTKLGNPSIYVQVLKAANWALSRGNRQNGSDKSAQTILAAVLLLVHSYHCGHKSRKRTSPSSSTVHIDARAKSQIREHFKGALLNFDKWVEIIAEELKEHDYLSQNQQQMTTTTTITPTRQPKRQKVDSENDRLLQAGFMVSVHRSRLEADNLDGNH